MPVSVSLTGHWPNHASVFLDELEYVPGYFFRFSVRIRTAYVNPTSKATFSELFSLSITYSLVWPSSRAS